VILRTYGIGSAAEALTWISNGIPVISTAGFFTERDGDQRAGRGENPKKTAAARMARTGIVDVILDRIRISIVAVIVAKDSPLRDATKTKDSRTTS
jgi:hypothetical protein